MADLEEDSRVSGIKPPPFHGILKIVPLFIGGTVPHIRHSLSDQYSFFRIYRFGTRLCKILICNILLCSYNYLLFFTISYTMKSDVKLDQPGCDVRLRVLKNILTSNKYVFSLTNWIILPKLLLFA